MWTRGELKTRAKGVLKLLYWRAFIVSLILIFAGGSGNGGGNSNFNFNNRRGLIDFNHNNFPQINYGAILVVIASIILVATLLRVLVGYNLEVGGRRFFLTAAREEKGELEALGHTFKKGRYLGVIKTMFYKGVLIFLWSLLLVIPGIIKSYAYRMVPYILAENPNIGYKRAVDLSNKMTMGQKSDIFVLDLSFIGWYLLGLLLFVVGTLFVHPYVDATNAELYLKLRQKALDEGLVTLDELVAE